MRVKGTDIYLTRGDTAKLTLDINMASGLDIDEVYFTVKKNVNTDNVTFSKSWVSGTGTGITKQGTDNIFIVQIDHNDTKNEAFGRYRYDVQIVYSESGGDPQILTVVKPSVFVIEEEVTTGSG